MKLLIGTLFSGENEFDECLAAITKQTYKKFDHLIIKNLPELEAHNKLYQTFINQKDEYELLIKIDADTVLISEQLFKNIVEKFSQNPDLEILNIGVQDFFTDEMIAAGIQIYRNTVRWDFNKDTLFPDIPIMKKNSHQFDKTDLAPAAIHCKNPSIEQSFHYGVHRGLKSIQKDYSTTHWALLQKVWENFLRTGEKRIGLAVLGAELVYAGIFTREDQNYTNPKMDTVLKNYQMMNSREIKKEIQKLRSFHWGFLPQKYRQKVLRFLRGHIGGRWDK
jgi:hypothetical protein